MEITFHVEPVPQTSALEDSTKSLILSEYEIAVRRINLSPLNRKGEAHADTKSNDGRCSEGSGFN